jgi:hypothetical protein
VTSFPLYTKANLRSHRPKWENTRLTHLKLMLVSTFTKQTIKTIKLSRRNYSRLALEIGKVLLNSPQEVPKLNLFQFKNFVHQNHQREVKVRPQLGRCHFQYTCLITDTFLILSQLEKES